MPPALVREHLDVVEQLHLRFAEAGEPIGELAFHRREEAFHRPGLLNPVPQRRLGQAEIPRRRGERLFLVQRTALALKSSVKLRRVRRGLLSAMVDIVSTFRKMSTKADQAHTIGLGTTPSSIFVANGSGSAFGPSTVQRRVQNPPVDRFCHHPGSIVHLQLGVDASQMHMNRFLSNP